MILFRKIPLFLGLFSFFLIQVGMTCGKLNDIPVQVKNTSTFRFSLVDALNEANIPAENGLIPKEINQRLSLQFVDKIDLKTHPRSKDLFENYQDHIHTAYINKVFIRTDRNSFSKELPLINVSIAPLDANRVDNVVATVSLPNEGETEPIVWEPKGYDETVNVLKSFGIQVKLSAPYSVKGGLEYPKKGEGLLDISVEFDITFILRAI